MDRKDQLQQKLTEARGLVKAYFEVDECPWEKRFHQDQQRCRECADGFVCEWLFVQDPAPDLAAYDRPQLRDALIFAVGYLEEQMRQADHPAACPCATCAWVRDSYPLIEQA